MIDVDDVIRQQRRILTLNVLLLSVFSLCSRLRLKENTFYEHVVKLTIDTVHSTVITSNLAHSVVSILTNFYYVLVVVLIF